MKTSADVAHIASSLCLELASQAPSARPLLILGQAPSRFETKLSSKAEIKDAPGASARVSDFWRSNCETYHKNMTFLLCKTSLEHRYSINPQRSEHSFPVNLYNAVTAIMINVYKASSALCREPHCLPSTQIPRYFRKN